MKDLLQTQVIDFLSRPDTYAGETDRVERVETHISVVFLVGDKVFKLKRSVTYPYLDFSTLALRKHYCEAEVVINRRSAPDLYKGVVPVTRDPVTGFRLGGEGDGEVVEWLVEMARFDEQLLFDRLGPAGKLNRHLMMDLAETIADFHLSVAPHPEIDNRQRLETLILGNADSFSEFGAGIFDEAGVQSLINAHLSVLRGTCGDRIDARRQAGFVRHCHGDLHLRNICLFQGHPTLFDAIEFNQAFSHIDVFYDLAFMLMDLDHRGLRRLANIALNRYLDVTGDISGLGCMGLYLSICAAIRAHVSAAMASRHSDPVEAGRLSCEARSYLEQAQNYLEPVKPRLVAVGGLSGSGKSRMGRELAPFIGTAPGARIARSDVLRKRLAGVEPLTRLQPEGYTPEMTRKTYDAVYNETRQALAEGHSVVADAVFAKPDERRAIARVAHEMGVSFQGIWLEAPPEVMQQRVTKRQLNASDADASVVRMQLSYDLGDIDWARIDSSQEKSVTLEKGMKTLGLS